MLKTLLKIMYSEHEILGYNVTMKIIIFRTFTVLTSYFTMLIVSGMYFSPGFHP